MSFTPLIPQKCPAGNYCPAGTKDAVPCEAGTFSSQVGLAEAGHCTSCPANFYCDVPGATTDSGIWLTFVLRNHLLSMFISVYSPSSCGFI